MTAIGISLLVFFSGFMIAATLSSADAIIGGQGEFRYQFMPSLMAPPGGANFSHCHGLEIDADGNIYLTYVPQGADTNCLIKWRPDGTGAEFVRGGDGADLCAGTPHGLKLANEEGKVFFYHANNQQKLVKTTLDGVVVWQVKGNFGQNASLPYRPTWHAAPPDSNFTYVCDGYGSSNVYVFTTDGKWTGRTFGGKGGRDEHGKFNINHGCTYDSRIPGEHKIVVSDRVNSRLEWYTYDPASPDVFDYSSTVDLTLSIGPKSLPCNVRMYPAQDGRAVMADLSGPVAVMDRHNTVISVVNVSVLIGDLGHKNPHDAVFLANGDMVVATYSPGRISYWKKI